jgi:hypothetical protein
MLTTEQLKANIEALEKQGASPQEIQGWLNTQKNQVSQSQSMIQESPEISPTEKSSSDNFLKDHLISHEVGVGMLKGLGSSVTGLGQLVLKGASKIPFLPEKAQSKIQGGIEEGEKIKEKY